MSLTQRRSKKVAGGKLPFGHCLATFNIPQPQVAQHEGCPAFYKSNFSGKMVEHFCVCPCHSANAESWAKNCKKITLPEGYIVATAPEEPEPEEDDEPDTQPERTEPVSSATTSVELDVNHDRCGGLDRAFGELERDLDVDHEVLEAAGPTGWPVVRFTGSVADISELEDRFESLCEDDSAAEDSPVTDTPTEALTGVVSPPTATKTGYTRKQQVRIPPPVKRGNPSWTMEDGVAASVGMDVITRKGETGRVLETKGRDCLVRMTTEFGGDVRSIGYHNLNEA